MEISDVQSKKLRIEFWGIFAVIMVVGILFCTIKGGFKEDELYSFGLSNSHSMPFLTGLFEGKGEEGTVINQQELWNYITVNEGEAFDYQSVYYNQTQDVHPPLFYFLLHTICSFFPETFSKWMGLILNLFLFAGTLLLLYGIMVKLLEGKKDTGQKRILFSHRAGLMAMILYGLSMAGLSELVLIRMYMLASFLNVLLAWWVLCLLRKQALSLYLALGLTVFAGLLTHYYFVFYAFFVCVLLDIYFLIKKKVKAFVAVSVAAILGVLCMYLYYPACIGHLMTGHKVSGEGFVGNITSLHHIASAIFITCKIMAKCLTATSFMGVAGCVLILIRRKKLKGRFDKDTGIEMLVLVLPAALDFMAVSLLTPSLRYIYNAIPLVPVAVAYVWYWVMISWDCETGKTEMTEGTARSWQRNIAYGSVVISFFLSVIMLFFFGPDHLYRDHRQYYEALRAVDESPVIYYTGDYHPSITENVTQLLLFPNAYVCKNAVTDRLVTYVDEHASNQNIVVFFAKYPEMFDSEVYLSELNGALGEQYEGELLYDGRQSVTYLMKKK